jgi:hypothetical protein
MADLEKIKERIQDIAQRPRNVELSEIEWVANNLANCGYAVKSKDARHGKLFQVNGQTFMVNHHTGNKQVRSYSVKDFISAMIELSLYD